MNKELQKSNAAKAALRFVGKGKIIGLGGGSTIRKFIDILSRQKPKNSFVAADKRNARYAKAKKLKVFPLGKIRRIDVDIDGADGVDRRFNMIKGAGGGAIANEKRMQKMSRKVIIIIDSSKMKKDLLKLEIPIEVRPDAKAGAIKSLKSLGASAKLKKGFKTDRGNAMLNARFRKKYDLAKLERIIKSIPGVIEAGLFTNKIDYLIVGKDKGAKVLQ